MKIKNIKGYEVSVNQSKYLIDWDKKVSKPQKKVKDVLRKYWEGNTVCEEFVIPGSKMRVDLINFTLSTIVEISPQGSHKYNKFFNKNRQNFLASSKRDLLKVDWAGMNGFRYVEIDDEDLKDEQKILGKVLL